MFRRIGLLSLLLCLAPVKLLAMGRAQGWCENGNVSVTVNGGQTSGSQKFQQSYPACTVTVYQAGTTTLVAIFADNSGTVRGNPFTAANSGQWFFYAANGAYDVRLSGGGIPVPFTIGAISIIDPTSVPSNASTSVTLQSSDFNFSQTRTTSLSAGVGASVPMSPCPAGANGSNVGYYVYISGGSGGAAEAVLITGGSCANGASTGTLNFTPVNSHTGSYQIGSATCGMQEAEDSTSSAFGVEVLLPAGQCELRQSVYVDRPLEIKGLSQNSSIIHINDSGTGAAQNYYAFNVNTSAPFHLYDVSITTIGTPTGGGGVSLNGVGGVANQHSRIWHNVMVGLFNSIFTNGASRWTIEGNTIKNSKNYGTFVQNSINGDDGDSFINDNFYFDQDTGGPGAGGSVEGVAGIYVQSAGGLRITSNKINGFTTCIDLHPIAAVTGQITITSNGCDGFGQFGLHIESNGVGTWYSVLTASNYYAGWLNNWIGVALDTTLINTGTIVDSTFQRYGTITGAVGIKVTATNFFDIHGNIFTSLDRGIWNTNTSLSNGFLTIGQNTFNNIATANITNGGDPTTTMYFSGQPITDVNFPTITTPKLMIWGAGETGAAAIIRTTTQAGGGTLDLGLTLGADVYHPGAVIAGNVGQLRFLVGVDRSGPTSSYERVAEIRGIAESPITTTSTPGTLSFDTTASGSLIPTPKMVLVSDGGLVMDISSTGYSKGLGTINVSTGYYANGTVGATSTFNLNGCNLVAKFGLVISSTCTSGGIITATQISLGPGTAGGSDVIYASSDTGSLITESYANNSSGSGGFVAEKSRGTHAAKLDVQNGDNVGAVLFEAFSGGSYFTGPSIIAKVSNTFTTGQAPPMSLDLYTNAANTARAIAIHMNSDQSVTMPQTLTLGPGTLDATSVVFGSSDTAALITSSYANNSAGGGGFVSKKSRGTHASPTDVQNGDRIGALIFAPYSGTLYFTGASIVGTVSNTFTTGQAPPMSLDLYTNAANTTRAISIHMNSDQTVQMPKYGAGTATFDASGNISSVSDERLKDIQGAYTPGLAEILQLNPIIYKWNEKSGLEREHVYSGFSAQNVQSVLPLAVGQNSDGYLTLQDRGILGALVNAVKELNERLPKQ